MPHQHNPEAASALHLPHPTPHHPPTLFIFCLSTSSEHCPRPCGASFFAFHPPPCAFAAAPMADGPVSGSGRMVDAERTNSSAVVWRPRPGRHPALAAGTNSKLSSFEGAAKCAKLTDLFGAGFTSPAAAGAPGDERGGLDHDERVEADMVDHLTCESLRSCSPLSMFEDLLSVCLPLCFTVDHLTCESLRSCFQTQ
ncbi:unnamed protein product, partial [Pleuronectes platessa]